VLSHYHYGGVSSQQRNAADATPHDIAVRQQLTNTFGKLSMKRELQLAGVRPERPTTSSYSKTACL